MICTAVKKNSVAQTFFFLILVLTFLNIEKFIFDP